jgi:hypothetical protein
VLSSPPELNMKQARAEAELVMSGCLDEVKHERNDFIKLRFFLLVIF